MGTGLDACNSYNREDGSANIYPLSSEPQPMGQYQRLSISTDMLLKPENRNPFRYCQFSSHFLTLELIKSYLKHAHI